MIDIDGLSRDEKLDLIERLWDSLVSTHEDIPIPDWHREELDRRLDAFEQDGCTGTPAEELLSRLRGPNEGRPPTAT
jgi:putative addiction module component (TIGR02574 family)